MKSIYLARFQNVQFSEEKTCNPGQRNNDFFITKQSKQRYLGYAHQFDESLHCLVPTQLRELYINKFLRIQRPVIISGKKQDFDADLHYDKTFFFVKFGDGTCRQAEAWIVLLAGMAEVNALAQGALRQFKQPWIERSTFQLGGGHFTTELKVLTEALQQVF